MTANLSLFGNVSEALNDSLQPATHPVLLAANYMTYRIATATHVYFLPVIVFIGLIGNSLSFLIMLKPHNRRISCCNYIAGLAVSDNLMLLNALDYWTISLKNRPLFYIECNIMSYLFGANSFVSMLLIFAMTVDRFLAIRFPFKARELCSAYRAKVAMVTIIVVSLLYTLPYYFTAQLIMEVRTCVAVNTTDIYSTIYNWVNIFLGSIVPFFGLLTMNAVIIATVRRRGNFSASADGNHKEKPMGKTKEKSIEKPAEKITEKAAVPPMESKTDGQYNPGFHDEDISEWPINFEEHTTADVNHTDDENVSPATGNGTIAAHLHVCCETDSEARGASSEQQCPTPGLAIDSNKVEEGIQHVEANDTNFEESHTPTDVSQARKQNDKNHTNKNLPNSGTTHCKGADENTDAGKPRKMTSFSKTTPSVRFQSYQKRRVARSGSRDNQLTIMLLLVTFTFLLLTLLLYVRYLLAIFWNYSGSVKHYADYLLLAHLSNRFFYMNSACNFFLYCISGNKFRHDVIALFVRNK